MRIANSKSIALHSSEAHPATSLSVGSAKSFARELESFLFRLELWCALLGEPFPGVSCIRNMEVFHTDSGFSHSSDHIQTFRSEGITFAGLRECITSVEWHETRISSQ